MDRFIRQFDEINTETEAYGQKELDRLAQYYDPDMDNSYELQNEANEAMCSFHYLLKNLEKDTMLSIISSLHFMWEKEYRNWLGSNIKFHLSNKHLEKAVWECNDINSLLDIFAKTSWYVQANNEISIIKLQRLIVNVFKHGNGRSLHILKSDFPQYYQDNSFFPEFENITDNHELDFERLKINEKDIYLFSEAIKSFWVNLPEYFFNDEGLQIVGQLKDLYNRNNRSE